MRRKSWKSTGERCLLKIDELSQKRRVSMADELVPLFTEEKAASKQTPPCGATTTEPGCFIYVKVTRG